MSTIDPLECFVGVPTAQVCSYHDENDKRSSKIGGQPVWWDELSAPTSISDIQCRNCNSFDSVIFVAQLYAPVDYDRSLYIFCCNKRACSLTSDGWTIIRNQQVSKAATFKSEISAKVSTAAETSSSSLHGTTDWAAVAAPAVTASASAWGNLLGDEEEVDMMSLLQARDAALASRKTEAIGLSNGAAAARGDRKEKLKGQNDATAEGANLELNSQLVTQALVCWKVDAISDPCPYGSDILVRAALNGGDDDEDEDEDGRYAVPSGSAVSDHVQQMLAGYIAAAEAEGGDDLGRDDPALLELLKREMYVSNQGRGRGKGKESKGKEEIKPSAVNLTDSTDEKCGGKTGNSRDGDGDTSMLKKSDCRSRVESAFQAAVSHAPSQVVRFAYGGDPLWCTYPPPEMSVPRCQCGSERVFEMQLMPGLLALQPLFTSKHLQDTERKILNSKANASVSVSAATITTTSSSSIKSLLDTLGGDTFEFGVVAVFSCPNSCSSSLSLSSSSLSSLTCLEGQNAGVNITSPKGNLSAVYEEVKGKKKSSFHICYEHAVVQPPADF